MYLVQTEHVVAASWPIETAMRYFSLERVVCPKKGTIWKRDPGAMNCSCKAKLCLHVALQGLEKCCLPVVRESTQRFVDFETEA